MENGIEKAHELVPSKQLILEIIRGYAENAEVVREESDELGVYLLDTRVWGENPGEYVQYEYMREGRHAKGSSLTTVIHKVFYEDDQPCGGHDVATFNLRTGALLMDSK